MGLFKPRDLQERQCIAQTCTKKQCSARISGNSLSRVTKYLGNEFIESEQKVELLQTIVRLLICNNHKDIHLQPQMDSLIRKYLPELEEHARTHESYEPYKPIRCHRSARNSRTTLTNKLYSSIKDDQFLTGSLYIFTWKHLPGYVKVGCAKGDSAKRIEQWAKCYSGAERVHSVNVSFPQRMEELVHLQMAERRYEVYCDEESCKLRYHDEWFKCSVEEMKSVVDGWASLATEFELYQADTRRLADHWPPILAAFSIEVGTNVNSKTLLYTARIAQLTGTLRTVHISESPKAVCAGSEPAMFL